MHNEILKYYNIKKFLFASVNHLYAGHDSIKDSDAFSFIWNWRFLPFVNWIEILKNEASVGNLNIQVGI